MDLKKIIEDNGLKTSFVAEKLFPGVKHPDEALWRHIRIESELKESQLIALAGLLKCSVDELLSMDNNELT